MSSVVSFPKPMLLLFNRLVHEFEPLWGLLLRTGKLPPTEALEGAIQCVSVFYVQVKYSARDLLPVMGSSSVWWAPKSRLGGCRGGPSATPRASQLIPSCSPGWLRTLPQYVAMGVNSNL